MFVKLPASLKSADVTTVLKIVFKNRSSIRKDNFRPAVLPAALNFQGFSVVSAKVWKKENATDKWKNDFDQMKVFRARLTNISLALENPYLDH